VLRYRGPIAGLTLVEHLAAPRFRETGPSLGPGYLIDYRSNQAVKAITRLLQARVPLYWLKQPVRTSCGQTLPAGTLYLEQVHRPLLRDLPVSTFFPHQPVAAAAWRLKTPRLGLYASFPEEVDEGWTRFLLGEFGFEFTPLAGPAIRQGDLSSQYDVLIFPDQPTEPLIKSLMAEPSAVGAGDGVHSLRQFVEQGGTLVLLNRSCALAVDHWALGLNNSLQQLQADDFSAPGSLLRMMVDTNHPLGYGLKQDLAGFVYSSPAFQIAMPWAESVAVYPGQDLLVAGLLRGERWLALQTAVACVPLGKGRVVLLGLRPQFRNQARSTYKFLFNAILYATAVPVEKPEEGGLH